MASLFDVNTRSAVLDRVRHLSPDQKARWGRFTAPAMVCHVSAGLRQALGELASATVPGPMARWPFNWLVIHVLPWPEGKAQSPPELLTTAPGVWASDLRGLEDLIARFGTRGPDAAWPRSSAFGTLSPRSWGVLQYKHLDHHLRQFGV